MVGAPPRGLAESRPLARPQPGGSQLLCHRFPEDEPHSGAHHPLTGPRTGRQGTADPRAPATPFHRPSRDAEAYHCRSLVAERGRGGGRAGWGGLRGCARGCHRLWACLPRGRLPPAGRGEGWSVGRPTLPPHPRPPQPALRQHSPGWRVAHPGAGRGRGSRRPGPRGQAAARDHQLPCPPRDCAARGWPRPGGPLPCSGRGCGGSW